MRAELVVPRRLRIIANLVFQLVDVLLGVFHLTVARNVGPHRTHLCLEDVGEGLQVISSGTITLADNGKQIAACLVERPRQSELGQQLVAGMFERCLVA